ncbi:DUF411 domain-containing protein [Erythrobacter arachoides]|uniref:DUF411 domain-containing protein n=1 Tax=Aurantiacibacter arachoides TaxID=1850444 RepID=A0A844ZZ61_9SPHN|nr:DUF411 domain-containing protein [Aurantiacibacter arachoides]MXO93463.1 DUF411 domain-containing protein [Aurantiacibacter arachoides]GGD49181.1 hypothetical protein GCM10011411_06190 [Aurantiacibacter arachoides]
MKPRRFLSLALLALAACSQAAQAATYEMFRDPNCGCCLAWVRHVDAAVAESVTVTDSTDMGALKDRLGVPQELRSCHTMVVEGYVIEGHVPAEDIARLLAERPEGVTGLAVPGMPVGSPGMEMGDRVQPYQVIAFGEAGMSVFATHP